MTALARAGAGTRPVRGRGRRVTFAQAHKPATKARPLTAGLADLRKERAALVEAAYEVGTKVAYKQEAARWRAWCKRHKWPRHRLTEDILSCYLTWRLATLRNAKSVIGALGWYFMPRVGEVAWKAVRNTWLIRAVCRGGRKANARPVQSAIPFPVTELDHIVDKFGRSPRYNDRTFAAMAIVCFWGVLRSGEITVDRAKGGRSRTGRKMLSAEGAYVDGMRFHAALPYSKVDNDYTGGAVFFARRDSGKVAHRVLYDCKADRDRLVASAWSARYADRAEPLFLMADGWPPTYGWFTGLLKKTCGHGYTGHSFRSGAATWYTLRGLPEEQIMRLGRWSTPQMYWKYVKSSTEVAVASLLMQRVRRDPGYESEVLANPVGALERLRAEVERLRATDEPAVTASRRDRPAGLR